jgi:hypothetical protein
VVGLLDWILIHRNHGLPTLYWVGRGGGEAHVQMRERPESTAPTAVSRLSKDPPGPGLPGDSDQGLAPTFLWLSPPVAAFQAALCLQCDPCVSFSQGFLSFGSTNTSPFTLVI